MVVFFFFKEMTRKHDTRDLTAGSTLQPPPASGSSGLEVRGLFCKYLCFCVCASAVASCGWLGCSCANFFPLTPPCSSPQGFSNLKLKVQPAVASTPQNPAIWARCRRPWIFFLKNARLAALSFSSPVFQITALWKFASLVQASWGRCWIAGGSWAIKAALGKAFLLPPHGFPFRAGRGPRKGRSHLQWRGRKHEEKSRASPTPSQEGLLPAWVGGGGN